MYCNVTNVLYAVTFVYFLELNLLKFTTGLTEIGPYALPWLYIKESLFRRFCLVQWHKGSTATVSAPEET